MALVGGSILAAGLSGKHEGLGLGSVLGLGSTMGPTAGGQTSHHGIHVYTAPFGIGVS